MTFSLNIYYSKAFISTAFEVADRKGAGWWGLVQESMFEVMLYELL